MTQKVFLGGTCNNDIWREKLIPELNKYNIDFFNPVVSNWTPDCQKEEDRQKKICGIHLYVITPNQTGFYSFAEIVDSFVFSNSWTIFAFYKEGWDTGKLKSLEAIRRLLTDEEKDYIGEVIEEDTEEDMLASIIGTLDDYVHGE
jgi:hypothetical protein